jgi:hypothetical protein
MQQVGESSPTPHLSTGDGFFVFALADGIFLAPGDYAVTLTSTEFPFSREFVLAVPVATDRHWKKRQLPPSAHDQLKERMSKTQEDIYTSIQIDDFFCSEQPAQPPQFAEAARDFPGLIAHQMANLCNFSLPDIFLEGTWKDDVLSSPRLMNLTFAGQLSRK